MHILDIGSHGFDAGRVVDLHAAMQAQVQHHPLEHVRQREKREHHTAGLDIEKTA